MAEESLFVFDRDKALRVLDRAKAMNADKTVPVRVDSQTVVFITPEQHKDPAFMKQFWQHYKK